MARRLFFDPISGLYYLLRRKQRKAPTGPAVEAMRTRAKSELPPRLAALAALYGFSYNRLTIKNNISNWGSCSIRGNINLNLRVVDLPKELQDYVMLHELCHLRYMNHGREFHALLESLCPHHRAMEKELRQHKLV